MSVFIKGNLYFHIEKIIKNFFKNKLRLPKYNYQDYITFGIKIRMCLCLYGELQNYF